MYKSIIRTIAFLAILTFSASAYAQSVEVSGTVTDEAGPLIGATVIVKGSTTNAVVTDIDGTYSIKVNAGETLVYSYIGYNDEERTVTANAVIDVMMSADVAMLEQVVVLGYGAQTKKKDLSASVGVVSNTEQLAQRPVTSTSSMLQGQIPGVNIANEGGDPTSSPNIVIRGQGSTNKENVLWVVDGVPGAPINSMNDVESIVVLKDAASAAIYGAVSGAGGVILVTTKKGKEGVNVIYDGLVGVRQASKMIQTLDAQQEIDMYKEAYKNSGMDLFTEVPYWNPENNPYIATTRTNWMDEVFRTALYHRHNVVVNAGTEKFKNRLSFSYTNDDGILVGTYKNELGINYVGDIQILKWVKLTENFRWGQVDQNSVGTTGSQSGGILSAMMFPRSAEVHQWDGTGYGGTTTEDPAYVAKYGLVNIHGDLNNPLRALTADNKKDKSNQVYTSTALEIGNFDNFKGFKFISRFTYQLGNSFYKNFSPKATEIGNKANLKSTLNYSTYRSETWRTENTMTYDRTFGKHTVGALLSTTADHYDYRNFGITGEGFEDEAEALQYINYAAVKNVSDGISGPDANLAIIARLAYSYDDRYFFTASWRRDYASRLPKEHNYGDFPAATAAWKISSEKFFPKNNAVTLLKLRASWGRIGNLGPIGYNYSANTLDKEISNELAQYGVLSNQTYGTMIKYTKALNNELTWETSEQTDIGLDMYFLKDRLTFSADFYDKRTYNLIQSQTTGWTSSIGLTPMLINFGEIKNRGIELALGWNDRVGNWSYFVNANAAYNRNWVSNTGYTDSDGNPAYWPDQSTPRDITFSYRTVQGGPLKQYYLIKSLGIFQSNAEAEAYKDADGNRIQPNAKAGDLKFEDYNGDGKINDDDRQLMGNSTPDWTFALNAGFTWKNLSVSFMFQGVEGAQALNFSKMASLSASSKSHNRSTEILNAWSEANKGSNIPRLARLDANGNFTTASSWYLENTSYIRLKNLTISYDITNAIRKAKFFNDRNSALSVYISGENLFTITPYTGLDPECGGEDMFRYPVSRILSLGLKLTL